MTTTTVTTTAIARVVQFGTPVSSGVLVTPCAATFMSCRLTSTQTCKTWKVFYPDCKNQNILCNASKGAYVAAITVCELGL